MVRGLVGKGVAQGLEIIFDWRPGTGVERIVDRAPCSLEQTIHFAGKAVWGNKGGLSHSGKKESLGLINGLYHNR